MTSQDYKQALDEAAAASSNPSLFLKLAEILWAAWLEQALEASNS